MDQKTDASPDIVKGKMVVFKDPCHPDFGGHPADRLWQEQTAKAYPGPFWVLSRPDKDHVVLHDENGKIIRFGSTECPLLHVGHLEIFQP
jgi:hypothetical protein